MYNNTSFGKIQGIIKFHAFFSNSSKIFSIIIFFYYVQDSSFLCLYLNSQFASDEEVEEMGG